MYKPMLFTNDDLAEGVYAASGSTEGTFNCPITGCWTGMATLNQSPELGQDCYTVHFEAHHANVGHYDYVTKIVTTFNQAVTVTSWNDVASYSVNGNVVTAYRSQKANGNEGFGGTGMYIMANSDIGIVSVYMSEEP